MESKIQKLVNELKAAISKKYQLKELRLFGSSARGDRTKESDIDIFVCLTKVNRTIEEDLFDMAYDLELKYGYTIDIFVFDTSIREDINSQLPVYQNILKEGIAV
jgi:predicted nucleotidyltransferase